MPTPLLICLYLLAPALILHLCQRYQWMDSVGSVLWAYVLGIALGNFNLLPEGAAKVQDLMTTITVPLAIPLMLFSSQIKDWKKMARSTMLSLIAGTIAVIIAIILGYLLLKTSAINELDKVGGMLVGVYTGGTPNLAALKLMLDIDSDTYLTLHTYDMLVSFGFLVFMITIAQRTFAFALKRTPQSTEEDVEISTQKKHTFKQKIKAVLFSLTLAIVIFAIAGGLSLLFSSSQQMVVVILTITTLGIIASLNKTIYHTPYSFETGMYLILVFSIVVASMVDISTFITEPPTVFYYILFTVFTSLSLHVLISRWFKVDVDTTIIVSTSLICSPAFVPFVATAIHNKKVIIGGITAGLIGFAIGNYLGFAISKLLIII